MILAPLRSEKDPKEKPIEQYYAKITNLTFSVPMLDQDGKYIPLRDAFGNQRLTGSQLLYVEENYQFYNLSSSNRHGYLSVYPIFSDTPKEVVKRLKELAEDEGSDIMTSEDYERGENPERYAEKQRRIEVEKEKAELMKTAKIDKEIAVEKALADQNKEHGKALAEMQKKLEAMEKKRGD